MRWTLADIRWDAFDPGKSDTDILSVVKTAAVIEANSKDYVTYLKNIFFRDAEFCAAAEKWGQEEAQHGAALGRWAELADPGFHFQRALKTFRNCYSVPLNTNISVRGSLTAELVARSVVESGTSSFYMAIRDASHEPVLRQIAHYIAADEFAHYQLFQKHLSRYSDEKTGRLTRLKVAVQRMREAEDDEIGYAFFAAVMACPNAHTPYDRRLCVDTYNTRAMRLYQRHHIDNAIKMIMRVCKCSPDGLLSVITAKIFWHFIGYRYGHLDKTFLA